MQSLIKTLQEEFWDKFSQYENLTPRKAVLPVVSNKIQVVTGMRRTGKTIFLWQEIHSLINQNIPKTRILYLNFEDDRLLPISQQKLASLLDSFYTLYPDNHHQLCYLFLDEIQNTEDWPVVIRRFLDSKQVKIYLSGSSSKLLSKEIATSLRGRSISTEIWPFSFDEYLSSRNITRNTEVMGQATIDKLQSLLLEYLFVGGFPEVTDLPLSERSRILQDYVDVVIFRDIIERHNITNIILIKYLIKTLLKNISSHFSTHKFYNDLKSQGIKSSKTTLYEYLTFIEDTYLAFTVPLHDESLRKVQTNPKKIYAIDTGLVNAYSMSFSNNLGRLFENLIYLDLRRKGYEVFYYLTKDRYEVDFLAKTQTGEYKLYQVVWDMENQETQQREKRALEQAEKETGLSGKLITPENYLREEL